MAGLPFLNAFKKAVDKLDTVAVGVRSIENWISTGAYVLNRRLSGDYLRGIPESRITLFAGPSGAGKSFITNNIALSAQKAGQHIVILDSEASLDTDYLKRIGLSLDENDLTYMSVTTIEDVNAVMSEFFSNYKKAYGKNNKEAQKVTIIIDSLAMLSSSTEMENYASQGVIKGDQGQLSKRRKAMLRMICGQINNYPITVLCTDHVYPQDPLKGDGEWAITNSTKFSCSIIGVVTKLNLKEGGIQRGVRMRFSAYKSRFSLPGAKCELEIPFDTGMSSITGLCEVLEADGVIAKGTQPGEKLKYICEYTNDAGDPVRIAFKESELTDEIAQELFKHPAARPMIARDEPEFDLDAMDASKDEE